MEILGFELWIKITKGLTVKLKYKKVNVFMSTTLGKFKSCSYPNLVNTAVVQF